MTLAREVQNRAFQGSHPTIPGLDYYSDWRPTCGLSHDYLDYFEMPEGNLGPVSSGEHIRRGDLLHQIAPILDSLVAIRRQ